MVYCKNVQRFARNVAEGAAALKQLKVYGVNVYFQDQGLDFFKNEDTINILLSIAASESSQKSAAVKFGHRKSQNAGKWTSAVPYGFDREEGYLQVNPAEAEVIRKIYSLFLDGWGRTKIIRHLNNTGITSRGYKWYQGHIGKILANPIYHGKQIQHVTESKDVNVTVVKQVEPEEHIITIRPEIAIISQQDFDRAQALIAKKAKQYGISIHAGKKARRESYKNMFSNILICGNCGTPMRRKKQRATIKGKTQNLDSWEYVCRQNDSLGPGECECRNAMPETEILQYVIKRITTLQEDGNEELNKYLDLYIKHYYEMDTSTKIKELDSQIKEIKKIQDNRVRLNALDPTIVSDRELLDSSREHRINLNALEREKSKLLNIDSEVRTARKDFSEFIKVLNALDINKLDNLTLKKIFNKIEIKTIRFPARGTPTEPGIHIFKRGGETWAKIIDATINILDKDHKSILFSGIPD